MDHPVIETIAPLLDAIGARLVSEEEAVDGDIHLHWDGTTIGIVRLPDLHGALARQISLVESELGGPLANLSMEEKRRAVRLLEERGAFTIRKGVEQVADVLGVSRFTIYNYINATRDPSDKWDGA